MTTEKKRFYSYLFLVISIVIVLITPSVISFLYPIFDYIPLIPRYYWHFILAPLFAFIISTIFLRTKKRKWHLLILLVLLILSYEINFYWSHYLVDLRWAKHYDLPQDFKDKILSYNGYNDYLEHEIGYYQHIKFRIEMILPWVFTYFLCALFKRKSLQAIKNEPLDRI